MKISQVSYQWKLRFLGDVSSSYTLKLCGLWHIN